MKQFTFQKESKTYDTLSTVLDRTYLGTLLFVIPIIIISAFRIQLIGFLPIIFISILGPMILLIVYINKKYIPYVFRAWIIILVAYTLGILDMYSLGMFSMGSFLLFLAAIMAAIFLNKKHSDIANIITITTFIAMVIFIYRKSIQYDFDIEGYFYSLEGWSAQLITFVILLAIIVYAVRQLTLYNFEANYEIRNKDDELEATNMQLKALDDELQTKYDELLLSKNELYENELKFRTLFNNLNDFVYSLDLQGRFLTVNATFLKNFRLKESDIIGKSFEQLIPNTEKDTTWSSILDTIVKTKSKITYLNSFIDPMGKLHTYEVTLIPFMIDDDIEFIIGTSHNVSVLLEKEKTIEKLAFEDPLTELPNRTAFKQFVKTKISNYTIGTYPFALIYIDLDNFKRINDAIGHGNGDNILKEVAKRLSLIPIPFDYLARMGGDEFAMILTITNTLDDLKHIVTSIQSLFNTPFIFEDTHLTITSSMGVTLFPYDGLNYSDLLKNADSALYEAKRKGKHDYRFFDAELKQRISTKIKMENQLTDALTNKEISLHYQPQFDSQGHIRGFEALMRWNNKDFGQVSPMTFIPILEENGLINLYGEWALYQALSSIKEINAVYSKEYIISVNISTVQFQSGKLVNYILRLIEELVIPAKFLEIEITESISMDNVDFVIHSLNQLNEIGVSIALDDFGTGYSSLSQLRKLPLKILKIDKSFIQAISIDSDEEIIVGSLINLAHDLNLKVVAEGIETEDQASYLRDCNCDFQQGFYHSMPIPLNKIHELLKS